MPARFRHFAINADDVGRARDFYGKVFDWNFNPWGPPEFFQTHDAGDGVMGALQKKQGNPSAFVPTFGVDDIRATLAAADANGGRIVMQPFMIEGVGEIGYFIDTEGNMVGVGQYVAGHFD
jgi:uncharacterized protein